MSKALFLLGTATLILNTVRPFGVNLSIPDALYLLALYVLILEGLKARQRVDDWMPFHPLWVPSLLVVVGGLLSSAGAVQPGVSIVITIKQGFVFSMWTSMGIVMARRGQVGNVVTALTMGALFTSSIAIWDFVFGARVGPAISGEPFLRWGRYSGTMGHPNELGYITAVVAPLILDRILGRARAGEATLVALSVLSGAFGVLLLANILAGSVTGYLGLVVSSMIVIVGHVARGYLISDVRPLLKVIRFSLIGLVLVSLAIVRADIPEILTVRNALDRMMYITGPHRLSLAQEALAYIVRRPLVGAGMDQSGTGGLDPGQLVTSIYIHNTVLQSWVAGGIITFAGVVFLYWRTLGLAVRSMMAYVRGRTAHYALGLSASVVGWFLMDMAQPNIYHRYTWLTFALLYGLTWREHRYSLRHAQQANVQATSAMVNQRRENANSLSYR